MNTPQGNHEQQMQVLEVQKGIADTENLTALLQLQAERVGFQRDRLNFQAKMLKHLKDAEATKEATKWVQELHENNQEAEAERNAGQKTNWRDLLDAGIEKYNQQQESIDISEQQPTEELTAENSEPVENKKH